MSDQPSESRPHFKREWYFVDAGVQLRLVLPLLAVLVVVALAYAAAIYLLPGPDAIETMTAEETRRLFLRANGVYFAVAVGALGAVAVFLSHRVAGPARVIERAVRGLRDGDYDDRLALRRGDSLKSLATAVRELRDQLREREEQRRKLGREIAARLDANDVRTARELLDRLDNPEAPL